MDQAYEHENGLRNHNDHMTGALHPFGLMHELTYAQVGCNSVQQGKRQYVSLATISLKGECSFGGEPANRIISPINGSLIRESLCTEGQVKPTVKPVSFSVYSDAPFYVTSPTFCVNSQRVCGIHSHAVTMPVHPFNIKEIRDDGSVVLTVYHSGNVRVEVACETC